MYTYTETLTERKHKCRNCGKVFEIPYYCVGWGYWYAGQICCGYRCMMAKRAKDLAGMNEYVSRESRARKPLSPEEIANVEKLIFRGDSNEKIALKVGRTKSAVCNIRKRMVREGRWTTTR